MPVAIAIVLTVVAAWKSLTLYSGRDSGPHRNAGGGRFQTENWKPLITFWNRDLFDGANAPDVPMDAILLVLHRSAPEASPPGITFQWLPAIGLDRSTPYRGLAVVSNADAARLPLDTLKGLRTFRPVIPQVTRERPLPAAYLSTMQQ